MIGRTLIRKLVALGFIGHYHLKQHRIGYLGRYVLARMIVCLIMLGMLLQYWIAGVAAVGVDRLSWFLKSMFAMKVYDWRS